MTAQPATAAMVRAELTAIQPRKLAGEWGDDARFTADLGLDSLDLVELVARLEQATGTFIPDEDLPLLASVDAVVEYLAGRRVADG